MTISECLDHLGRRYPDKVFNVGVSAGQTSSLTGRIRHCGCHVSDCLAGKQYVAGTIAGALAAFEAAQEARDDATAMQRADAAAGELVGAELGGEG